MHEWHSNRSRNPLTLIDEFLGYRFDTDYSYDREMVEVKIVKIVNNVFTTYEEALTFVTNRSYGSNVAYLAAYTAKKLSKGYQNAFSNFLVRYNEYLDFKNKLTVAYGRTASKATCPSCGSSINLKYGKRFKACPVCGSSKIISDSNWKSLETKLRMCKKAAENLSKEAEKNDVTFVCGIEWHC